MFLHGATLNDVPQMHRIQQECYPPNLIESTTTFKNIVKCNMSYVVGAMDTNCILGYALVHYIKENEPPSINSFCCPDGPDGPEGPHVFIHDIAVRSDARKKGIASQMVNEILGRFQKAKSISLISLHDAIPFWKKHGFNEYEKISIVETYGYGAIHMKK